MFFCFSSKKAGLAFSALALVLGCFGGGSPLNLAQAAVPAVVMAPTPTDELAATYYEVLGSQLALRGQLLAAKPLLQKALQAQPNHRVSLFNLAIVEEGLGENTQALSHLSQLLTLNPNLLEARYYQGRLYHKLGQTPEALTALIKAYDLATVTKNQGLAAICYDLGVLYAERHEFEASARYSGQAIALGRLQADAYNNYGYALANLGQLPLALQQINLALALEPANAATLDSKGFVYYQMGEFHQALKWYNRALEADPTLGELYLHKAQALEALLAQPTPTDPSQAISVSELVRAYTLYLELTPEAADKAQIEAAMAAHQAVSPAALQKEKRGSHDY